MKWVKALTLLDICRLVEFDKRAHPAIDQMSVDEYITWMKSGLEIECLRDQDDYWVGSYQIVRHTEEENFFAGFAVDPDFRGHGYGQMLMGHMIREYGHKKLTCKTRDTNEIMKSLLQKNAFFRDHDEVTFEHGYEIWTWWTRYPIKKVDIDTQYK